MTAKQRIRLRCRAYVRDVKSQSPCKDCGERYPYYVMQFDHVRGEKKFNLYKAGHDVTALSTIQEEIEKCDVVCANCHAERTYRRSVYDGHTLQDSAQDVPD